MDNPELPFTDLPSSGASAPREDASSTRDSAERKEKESKEKAGASASSTREDATSKEKAGEEKESEGKAGEARETLIANDGDDDATMPPMLVQYWNIKREHPDCLLFFHIGDFYELFFEDAVAAAPILSIQLTQRGMYKGKPVPLCGVPLRAVDSYLARLIRHGFRVAMCEQTESPLQARARGSRSVVRREVARVITPGTLSEDTLLEASRNNYLSAVARARGAFGFAWVDISTGRFRTQNLGGGEAAFARLGELLAQLEPGEILVPQSLFPQDDNTAAAVAPSEAGAAKPTPSKGILHLPRALILEWKRATTRLDKAQVSARAGKRRLEERFGLASLAGLGEFSEAELAAAGALLDYIDLTQRGRAPLLEPPLPEEESAGLAMDPATRRNLELTRGAGGERGGSLLAVIDRTQSGGGARLLGTWLSRPLTACAEIRLRHEAVAHLAEATALRTSLRASLASLPDLERACARLSLRRGGPRDLAGVGAGIRICRNLHDTLHGAGDLPSLMRDQLPALNGGRELEQMLSEALAESPPLNAREGGLIERGYEPRLDEERKLRDEGQRLISSLEIQYARTTGISNLRIRHNRILGHYIEVSPAHAGRLTESGTKSGVEFQHRQTMKNGVRFDTGELRSLESRLLAASARCVEIELEIYDRLVEAVLAAAETLRLSAAAAAVVDALASLAETAAHEGWVRPEMEEGTAYAVEGGRHPVVEAARRAEGEGFVANDCRLEEGRGLWLLTGPNMAGKSTFLRQNALLVILAQAGSFVPARAARLGVVDRLFSRVGAADDLARGRSTFMVEMLETAVILNRAGPRSFVILDELGRGTSTHDGLALAWASLERLHGHNRCRTLFATHYHELTALEAQLDNLFCARLAVQEWNDTIVFLHTVEAGAAGTSYGLHAARLAGVPEEVIARAREVLVHFEGKAQKSVPRAAAGGGGEARGARAERLAGRAVLDALRAVRPDALSPREALESLYALRALLPAETATSEAANKTTASDTSEAASDASDTSEASDTEGET